MARVSVSMAAIQQAGSICKAAIETLNNSTQRLNARYQEAGTRWRDDKYKQLGVIVNDCATAKKSPIDELTECLSKLKEIEKTIIEYESTNL